MTFKQCSKENTKAPSYVKAQNCRIPPPHPELWIWQSCEMSPRDRAFLREMRTTVSGIHSYLMHSFNRSMYHTTAHTTNTQCQLQCVLVCLDGMVMVADFEPPVRKSNGVQKYGFLSCMSRPGSPSLKWVRVTVLLLHPISHSSWQFPFLNHSWRSWPASKWLPQAEEIQQIYEVCIGI